MARRLQSPVPFRGERQAGIITAAQDRMHFAAFDVTTDNRADLVEMLREWTQMAERMTRGEETFRTGLSAATPMRRRRIPVRRSACPPPSSR